MPDPVSNSSERAVLRGHEFNTLDLNFEALVPEQWREWLKSSLERAAAKGNRGLAQKLVEEGAEIGDALHWAIQGGHGGIVIDLLESGASFAAKVDNGYTPLHLAAYQGKTDMVRLLLFKGADTFVFNDEECTPLMVAVGEGHVSTSLALLAAGADVSLNYIYDEKKTPVIHVAARKDVEILKAVIGHGAEVEAVATDQTTALHSAASVNNAGAIPVLVGAGANVEARNDRSETPLHYASDRLSHEALLALLKCGAHVNPLDEHLQTPLMVAAAMAGTQGAAEVVDSLLRTGADETVPRDDGRTAAGLIGAYIERQDRLVEDVERVRELLAKAPADRAWRRRGYLVLCRAHTDRALKKQVTSDTHEANTGAEDRSRAELEGAGGVAEDSRMNESTGGNRTFVVAEVLRLQEEGIFRTIVGYL